SRFASSSRNRFAHAGYARRAKSFSRAHPLRAELCAFLAAVEGPRGTPGPGGPAAPRMPHGTGGTRGVVAASPPFDGVPHAVFLGLVRIAPGRLSFQAPASLASRRALPYRCGTSALPRGCTPATGIAVQKSRSLLAHGWCTRTTRLWPRCAD